MNFCDRTLSDFIGDIKGLKLEETNLKYYISSEIFIEILEDVNYLHSRKPKKNSQRHKT
jgi:hypothetical protein